MITSESTGDTHNTRIDHIIIADNLANLFTAKRPSPSGIPNSTHRVVSALLKVPSRPVKTTPTIKWIRLKQDIIRNYVIRIQERLRQVHYHLSLLEPISRMATLQSIATQTMQYILHQLATTAGTEHKPTTIQTWQNLRDTASNIKQSNPTTWQDQWEDLGTSKLVKRETRRHGHTSTALQLIIKRADAYITKIARKRKRANQYLAQELQATKPQSMLDKLFKRVRTSKATPSQPLVQIRLADDPSRALTNSPQELADYPRMGTGV